MLSVKNDLELVSLCCLELSKRRKSKEKISIVDISLWNNALITFFRCFGSGLRKYKLDSSLFKNLDGEPLMIFEFFKNVRDKHLCHPVNMFEEIKIGAIIENQKVIVIGNLNIKRVFEEHEQIRNLHHFTTIALKKVDYDIKQQDTLVRKEANRNISNVVKSNNLKINIQDSLISSKKNRKQ